MKRIMIGAVAAVSVAALLIPAKAGAISAQKSILLDGLSGRVIYQNRADERSLIASTTKIMTALVVCERCNVLDRVRIPKEAVGIEGSSMYLKEGEVLTVQELLYGLMLRSGNDAAVALAIYCGGTVEGFAELMNDKARVLKLDNSHFVNPHGLDAPDHYSTAADLASLAAYAMDNPIFSMTVSTKNVTVGQRVLQNHNKLLWRVDGVNGVKTGYTKAAGRILVSSAERDGRGLICVTINAPDDWNDHKELLEQGFRNYRVEQIFVKGDVVASVPVSGGQRGMVDLLAAEDCCVSVKNGEAVTVELPGCGFLYAPVSAGASAGVAHVLIDGEPVGTLKLVYGSSIERKKEPKRKKKPLYKRIVDRFSR